MGYCVSCNHLYYEVPAAKVPALNSKYPSLLKDLEGWDFDVVTNDSDDLVLEGWEGEKWRGQETYLAQLAEFCEDGCGSKWTGEDGEQWEYQLVGGKHLSYSAESEAAELKGVLLELLKKYPEEAAKHLESRSLLVVECATEALKGV